MSPGGLWPRPVWASAQAGYLGWSCSLHRGALMAGVPADQGHAMAALPMSHWSGCHAGVAAAPLLAERAFGPSGVSGWSAWAANHATGSIRQYGGGSFRVVVRSDRGRRRISWERLA